MDHIPAELLHRIFTKLDLEDKLECMLVCRPWYDTLDRFTLLCSLSVENKQFLKFKDMLTRFPHRATQVEYLTLNKRLHHGLSKEEVCNMFPNLREVSFSIYSGTKSSFPTSKPFQFLHKTGKLVKIEDSGDCELAPQLAMSNVCHKLKTLDLDFREFHSSDVTSTVISQLKNMPVLEDLSMTYLKVKLTDLETMHNNLPSLKRLCLEDTYPISGEIPRDVVPANLITKLNVRINQVEDRDTYIQFYKYIGNKYLSAINPILDNNMEFDTDDQDILPRIYNEVVFPLYQKIGSKADIFIFKDYCDGLDAFRKFDDYGMRLKELTIKLAWQFEDVPFIEELSQSQQSK